MLFLCPESTSFTLASMVCLAECLSAEIHSAPIFCVLFVYISYTQGEFIPRDFQHVKNYHKNTMAFRSPESCLTLHFLWVPICVPDWWLLHLANQGRPTILPCSPQAQVLYLWEGFLCPHVQLISQWFTVSSLSGMPLLFLSKFYLSSRVWSKSCLFKKTPLTPFKFLLAVLDFSLFWNPLIIPLLIHLVPSEVSMSCHLSSRKTGTIAFAFLDVLFGVWLRIQSLFYASRWSFLWRAQH